jgi:Protein Family FAM60A
VSDGKNSLSFSSRFTDSKKYETDFIQCFQLDTPRRGEICNACVLLVKRFKRLPPGSNRHWGHVVDARTGPGLKSMTKFKKRKEEQDSIKESAATDGYGKLFKKSKKKTFKKETSSLGGSSDDSPPSPTESAHSDDFDDGLFEKKFFSYSTRSQHLKRQEAALKAKRKRKNPNPTKLRWAANHFNLFTDVVNNSEQWTQRTTCCGSIYECSELEAVIINVASFKPCKQHQQSSVVKEVPSLQPTKIQPISEVQQQQLQPTSTAIKKHQLFLKRHIEPSVAKCDISSSSSSSNLTEFSNNVKTELMSGTDNMQSDNNLMKNGKNQL